MRQEEGESVVVVVVVSEKRERSSSPQVKDTMMTTQFQKYVDKVMKVCHVRVETQFGTEKKYGNGGECGNLCGKYVCGKKSGKDVFSADLEKTDERRSE